ncbi:MAG: hypothetical protein K6G33_09090 [Ruminococcus sp.]|uniref:hypothetical protein n=1 Tax=Ruminococcus sp. TaxID=41978 RepID=UPI0025F8A919|nr:hypothetical protein [Ruminococcus sp.]MCR5600877.1 hypothetical protein [Ruminococcus sp.]
MKVIRTAFGISAAALTMAAGMNSYPTADAISYTAPSDIELNMGSAEIDRSTLNTDRVVEIPVYIWNNPGFVSLNVIFDVDERLRFDSDHVIKSDVNGLMGVNIYGCSGRDNTISASFIAENRFNDEGKIGSFIVTVPAGTPVGTYRVNIWESCGDFSTTIMTHNNSAAVFGLECFSVVDGGVIDVVEHFSERPPVQQINEENPQEQQNNEDQHDEKKNDDPQNEAPDPVTTSAGSETTKVTAKVTTSGIAKKTSVTSEDAAVTVSSTVSYVQSSINPQSTDYEEIASQKQENNTLERFLFPVICSAIMIAVCAAVVISIIKGGS